MEPADFPTRETVYAKIRADLDQYGWSLISSIYRDELFTHTVGLSWGYKHQEIELIGLNQEIAAMLLNELARRVVNGEKFHSDCHFEDIEAILDFQKFISKLALKVTIRKSAISN